MLWSSKENKQDRDEEENEDRDNSNNNNNNNEKDGKEFEIGLEETEEKMLEHTLLSVSC